MLDYLINLFHLHWAG